MTQSISPDRMEFIEVDGLKIRFQRGGMEGQTPIVANFAHPPKM